jgi:IclR family acetate operon transcriptional repressor
VTGKYKVPAVVSAVAVLRELAARPDGATQAELVKALDASKSSMHNLLSTLESEGMVVREERTRVYSLGPTLGALGAVASEQMQALEVAAQAVAPLALEYGISFAIAYETLDGEAQIIRRFYPPTDVHVGVTLGATFAAPYGALGKCLLALQSPEDAEAALREAELVRYTEKTITDPDQILAEVEAVRERGWAVSRGELNQNNALASILPVGSGPRLFVLCLGFADRLDEERMVEIGDRLFEMSEWISGTSETTGFTAREAAIAATDSQVG